MEDDFYIVLPSNSQTENTPAQFLTNFSHPFRINNPHEWEVGLKEINFKNTIKTINNDCARVKVDQKHSKVTVIDQPLNFSKSKGINYSFTDQIPWVLKDDAETKLDKWKAVDLKTSPFETNDFKILLNEDGFVEILNLTKFRIHLGIPATLAICLGFQQNSDILLLTHDPQAYFNCPPIEAECKITAKWKPIVLKSDSKWIILNPFKFHCTYNIAYDDYITIEEKAFLPLKSGTYVDPKELETELNTNSKFNEYFKFQYDQRLNRFDIITVTTDTTATLELENGLHDVLGFTTNVLSYNKKPQKGQMEVNLLRGITSLFVYCDVIKPYIVGNVMAPLLRTVTFNVKQYGEMIHVNYTNPMYLNLNQSYFDKMNITIYDSVGELIPFVEGLTTIILHFKRKA